MAETIQATNRAMMTFLLYKWFPVKGAQLFALMLLEMHALHWRDAEGGKTESIHDFWTRLCVCIYTAVYSQTLTAFK